MQNDKNNTMKNTTETQQIEIAKSMLKESGFRLISNLGLTMNNQ
jgi:hypothetical protein